MNAKPKMLETPRLVLKPLEDGDLETFIRLASDERIKKTYMLPDLHDKAEEEAFFRRMRDICASDAHFMYGIYRMEELIGLLNDCEIEKDRIELGYFIAPAHWNRGYASEALRAAIEALFDMGFRTVTAGYFAENTASRRVMEKCGMHPIPRTDEIPYRGAVHRCLYCEITREDADRI